VAYAHKRKWQIPIIYKWWLDGSQKAFSGIKHVVPVQLDYHLAQPVNADEQSAYTTINHKE